MWPTARTGAFRFLPPTERTDRENRRVQVFTADGKFVKQLVRRDTAFARDLALSADPAQQFLYQPAVDQVLREGVARFGNVEVLLEHECLRAFNAGDAHSEWVELMLADLRTDTFKRLRASYVIAADGGSSPTRGLLGVGYTGRTYTERWVVIDTKVIREWDGHDRLRFH